jgi:hypothetical protein
MIRWPKTRAIILVLMAGILLLGVHSAGAAETASAGVQPAKAEAKAAPKLEASVLQPEKPVIVKTMEHTSGSVVGVNAASITVLYAETEKGDYEIYLPFDQNLKLDHYRNRSEIKMGDIVELEYEKVTVKKGDELQQVTMAVKKVRFVKRPQDVTALASEKEGP